MQPYRAFLKSDRWEEWRHSDTDQKKNVRAPDLERACAKDARVIPLPDADTLSVGQMPLAEAIRLRQSHRKYTKEALTLDELAFFLWATQGVRETGQFSGRPYVLRTVPSAGARHPFETYLVVNRVQGLEPGLYRYQSLKHQLCFLGAEDDLVERTHRGCYDQYVKQSAVTFIWTAVPYRTEWRYSILSPKLIALDVGHVCQNLYLACAATGAGTCAIGAYDQHAMDTVLGLDGEEEFVVYVATVGKVK